MRALAQSRNLQHDINNLAIPKEHQAVLAADLRGGAQSTNKVSGGAERQASEGLRRPHAAVEA
jgi:hypothetical protein